MTIEVEGPDGSIAEFPDGTPADVIKTAMAKRFGGQAPANTERFNFTGQRPKGPTLRNYEPTLRDRMGAAVQDAAAYFGLSDYAGGKLAKGFTGSSGVGTEQMGLVDLVPGPSNVLAYQDMNRDFDQGRYVSGTLNAVSAALPAGKAVTNSMLAATRPKPTAQPRLSEQAAKYGLNIPRVLDPDPNALSRTATDLAGRASGVPLVGNPLAEKVAKGREAIDARIAASVKKSGPAASSEVAGERLGDAARDWMRTTTKDEVDAAYRAAEAFIPKNFRGRMPELEKVARQLMLEDAAAFSNANKPVIDAIRDALNSPHGITIEGANRLRQLLSAQGKPGLAIADNATAQPAFKRAAGALSKDVENMIRRGGGSQAIRAMDEAKKTFQRHQKTRTAVEKVLGKGALQDMSGASGEKVIARIHALARDGATGDAIALRKLKGTVDAESWNGMRRALNEKMGRDSAGEFNALKWAKEFAKLTPSGKRFLYGKELTSEYQGLVDVLNGYVKATRRVGNPSRSGDLVTGVALATSAIADGGVTVMGVLKARWWMNYMGNPRVVRATKNFVKASRNAHLGNATAATVRAAARKLAVQVELAGGSAQEVFSGSAE